MEPRILKASVMSSLFAELSSFKFILVATRIVIAMYSFVGSESPGFDLLVIEVEIWPE